jgi:diaminohydroxyphosphoribosylaminopyrimidine deaminase / 5-amino-6-(5-phosphoribosylamino)uracil reductase
MKTYENAMKMALNAAEQFFGATAPNPPVGCIALDKNGKVLLGAAHQGAGSPHAEAKVLDLAAKLGKLSLIETLVVTLEPCNHHGKTPPCTEAILKHKNIRRVVYGSKDPNPNVKGGGAERLKASGIEVIEGILKEECDFMIRAFRKWSITKLPYVVLKGAFTQEESMIPPAGQKTFTSQASLYFAHELRKKSDAIWVGSGTVLADSPELTVRWMPDHPGKKRFLILSDRRRRIPSSWIEKEKTLGFLPHFAENFSEGLEFLGKNGVLQVLIEAGPELRAAWEMSGLWDESVIIKQGKPGEDDAITIDFAQES